MHSFVKMIVVMALSIAIHLIFIVFIFYVPMKLAPRPMELVELQLLPLVRQSLHVSSPERKNTLFKKVFHSGKTKAALMKPLKKTFEVSKEKIAQDANEENIQTFRQQNIVIVVKTRADNSSGTLWLPIDYPIESQFNGEQGRVVLLVNYSSDGTVVHLKLKESSQVFQLDQAAMVSVRRSQWRWKASEISSGFQAEIAIHYKL